MEVQSEFGNIQRKFGHIIITWKIENYCLATCRENGILYSPEFYVRGPQSTKWRMCLNSEQKLRDTFGVALYLERLESDSGPDIVWVNWKLWLVDCKAIVLSSADSTYFFDKNGSFRVDLERKTSFLNNLRPFDDDTVSIRCQMIVRHEGKKISEKSSDVGLRSLSTDLGNLYKRRKDTDIVFKVDDDQEIKAHKAVLHSRNQTFATLLDKELENNEIKLTIVENEALDDIVAYLYSGNKESALAKPSISLYECVMYFNVEGLKSDYAPDELMLHTAMDVQEYVFLWLITDFTFRNEECIRSPILNKGISDTCWQLSLYPEGGKHDVDHIAIFAQIVEGMKPLEVCLEFAIMDNNREFFLSKRLQRSIEGHEKLGYDKFVERDYLNNSSLLYGGALRIVFKLRMSSSAPSLSVGSRMMSLVSSNETEESYNYLSRDMKYMCKYGKFKDIDLYSEESPTIPLRVHKCILAARSRIFKTMFSKMIQDQTFLMVPNIDHSTLQILISYMYCGKLKELDIPQLLKVYEAAESFAISSLKDTCSRVLPEKLEVQSACSILEFADAKKENTLKLATFQFIYSNIQTVQDRPSWKNLTVAKSHLCLQFDKFVEKLTKKLNMSPDSQDLTDSLE